jgi:hypothetical protein
MVYSQGATGALPVINQTNRTDQGAQAGQQAGQQLNVYSPEQQALQGQVLQQGNNLLTGNISPTFGVPQSVYDAAMFNFNKYQAPQLAAQYGTGSPAINSAMQELQLQLASQSGQKAVSNSISAYQAAADYAFRPQGQTQQQTNNQTNQSTSGQTNWGLDTGALLNTALNATGLSF